MRLLKVLAAAGFVLMAGSIIYGFTNGNFGVEGSVLLALAWGRVTLIDIYVSFLLFWGWIAFREDSWWRSAIWLVFMIVLGSLTACLYLFLALQTSQGDWQRFWFGRRAAAA